MRLALTATCLAALLVAGCSRESGDEDAFRDAIAAICVSYDEKIEAVGTPPNLEALVDTSLQIADLIDEQQAELERIPAPPGLRDTYSDWLELTEKGAASAREISAAAADEDNLRIQELADLAQQDARQADRLANELGVEACMVEEEDLTNR